LADAEKRNPGPWIAHTIHVAKAAESIATAHPDLDPGVAFILGYLHDIRHTLDGYTFLAEEGFEETARICLTHSFPVKKIEMVPGKWDCSAQELAFIENYLASIEFTPYDRLIQLCDALALPSGFCLMEQRLMDVALRYGVDQYTVPRWKAYFAIQAEFDQAIGQSIYRRLDGVIENTFGFRS